MKLSKYRIIQNKQNFFIPQKRLFWVFWKSFSFFTGYDLEYEESFLFLETAEDFIQSAIKNDEQIREERNRKIVVMKEYY